MKTLLFFYIGVLGFTFGCCHAAQESQDEVKNTFNLDQVFTEIVGENDDSGSGVVPTQQPNSGEQGTAPSSDSSGGQSSGGGTNVGAIIGGALGGALLAGGAYYALSGDEVVFADGEEQQGKEGIKNGGFVDQWTSEQWYKGELNSLKKKYEQDKRDLNNEDEKNLKKKLEEELSHLKEQLIADEKKGEVIGDEVPNGSMIIKPRQIRGEDIEYKMSILKQKQQGEYQKLEEDYKNAQQNLKELYEQKKAQEEEEARIIKQQSEQKNVFLNVSQVEERKQEQTHEKEKESLKQQQVKLKDEVKEQKTQKKGDLLDEKESEKQRVLKSKSGGETISAKEIIPVTQQNADECGLHAVKNAFALNNLSPDQARALLGDKGKDAQFFNVLSKRLVASHKEQKKTIYPISDIKEEIKNQYPSLDQGILDLAAASLRERRSRGLNEADIYGKLKDISAQNKKYLSKQERRFFTNAARPTTTWASADALAVLMQDEDVQTAAKRWLGKRVDDVLNIPRVLDANGNPFDNRGNLVVGEGENRLAAVVSGQNHWVAMGSHKPQDSNQIKFHVADSKRPKAVGHDDISLPDHLADEGVCKGKAVLINALKPARPQLQRKKSF